MHGSLIMMTQYLDYIYNYELRRRGQTDGRTEHNVVSIFSGLWLLPPPLPPSSVLDAICYGQKLKGDRAGGWGRGGQIDRVQYERERDNSGRRRSCQQGVSKAALIYALNEALS